MGAFFTNVQVFLGDRDPEEARRALVEAIRAQAASEGFAEVGTGEAGDRAVVIGPASGRFLAVYDEATEDQDDARLAALAAHLSGALSTQAVGVLVHDSDVLLLRCAARGEGTAAWSSWPGYGGGKRAGKKRAALDPALFREMLAPGRTEEEIAAVLGADELFAEATLAALAELLGMDGAACALGYRYLAHSPAEARLELRFRAAQRPAYEQDASGPPAFELGGYTPRVELSEGEPLRLSVQVQSRGGAGQGVLVSVWGEAVERGLVEADHVRVGVGRPPEQRWAEAPLREGEAGGKRVRFAQLADAAFPAGLGGTGFPDARGGNLHRAMDAWFDRQLWVFVEGNVVRAGEGKLGVGVTPLENRHEGAAGVEMRVAVGRAPRRPLRAPAAAPAHQLRPLETPAKLFAFVALGASRKEAAEIAAAAFERWGAVLAERGEGRYQTAFFGPDPTSRPKCGSRKSAGFFAGKWWRDTKATLAEQRMFSATLSLSRSEDDPPAHAGGLALEGAIFPVATADDAVVPHLSLWLDLAGIPDTEAAAAEELLASLAEDAMIRGAGLQALVGRWAHEPRGEHSAYDQACGVGGTITAYRSWSARFLRGVTTRLWLGPELIARLGGAEAPAAVAEVTALGPAARVRLADPAQLDALEQALAPLLPDAATWHEAVMQLHRR